jgi:signal transduction histidine kinase
MNDVPTAPQRVRGAPLRSEDEDPVGRRETADGRHDVPHRIPVTRLPADPSPPILPGPPHLPHAWARHWRHDAPRPHWWPEGEPWPPAKKPDRRLGFLRKVGCFFGLIFALMVAASILAAIFSDDGGRHDAGPFEGFVVLILVAVGIFFAVRAVRRTAGPIAEVMSAADRVADGDYAVRVETRANGEVGRLVESFNAMTTRLQTNEEQRRNLFADVAHELRTPLSVIRGNAEGMLDGVYPRDDARLETILDATALMSRLLDDLRTLSLTDTGALRLHKEPTDVAELLDEIRFAFAPRAAEAGIAFALQAEPLPPLEIDPVRVRQVVENLLDNALRHTPRGGAIRVDVRPEGRAALFRVADTGAGIPAEALPHVFDRFWKSADSGGSGLGLAIARGLIETHGGQIRADSIEGRGTVVSFTLPVGGDERSKRRGLEKKLHPAAASGGAIPTASTVEDDST